MLATRTAFLAVAREEILNRYGKGGTENHPWAADPEKLERFMAGAAETVNTSKLTTNLMSDSFRAAWRRIGLKGKLTYKAVRALPLGG